MVNMQERTGLRQSIKLEDGACPGAISARYLARGGLGLYRTRKVEAILARLGYGHLSTDSRLRPHEIAHGRDPKQIK
jgi:hypothetical protein